LRIAAVGSAGKAVVFSTPDLQISRTADNVTLQICVRIIGAIRIEMFAPLSVLATLIFDCGAAKLAHSAN
jgi:hypothetical protein